MELASKYNPADVEGKWYQYWLDNHLFSSKPDSREPYTIVIPPPNVTGVLHMGHMLNNSGYFGSSCPYGRQECLLGTGN
jgi:valyl-tRNA synthetase